MTSHYRPWFVAVAEAVAGAATAGRSRHHAQGTACLLAAALCLGAWSCAPAVHPAAQALR